MAKASLSKSIIDAARPGRADYFLWDDKLAGFGLKVTPAGGKVYVFQYRVARPGFAASTPAKRYTIGKHGALTPDQARKRAKELAAIVAGGEDPKVLEARQLQAEDEARALQERARQLADELLFSRLADQWLDDYENVKRRRRSSVALAELVVRKHLKPVLGKTAAPNITRNDLQLILDAVPKSQTAMRRSVYAYAAILFGWMLKRGYIEKSPLLHIEKPIAPASRDRVLNDDELRSVWLSASELTDPFGSFVRVLMLTMQRRSEVTKMNWTELDRSERLWTIPPDRAKNGLAHLVHLTEPVIEELDRLAGSTSWPKAGYVFTTTGRSPLGNISKIKTAIDNKIKERADHELVHWRLHDLRRTGATILQRLGVRFEVTEAVLNHVSGARSGVAGIYQRHDWKDEKRAALESYSMFLSKLFAK